jgi:hypothetical protein
METTATLLALLYHKQTLREGQVQGLSVGTNNKITVVNLERQGASRLPLHETRQTPSLLQKRDVRLMVTHIPGLQNEVADALSGMDRGATTA